MYNLHLTFLLFFANLLVVKIKIFLVWERSNLSRFLIEIKIPHKPHWRTETIYILIPCQI